MTIRRCGDSCGSFPHCEHAICEITYLAPDRYFCEQDGAYLDTEAKREGLRNWKLRPCRYGLPTKTSRNGTERGKKARLGIDVSTDKGMRKTSKL